MDIPSIKELKEKKRKLFNKIPEDTIGQIYRCTERKVIHDYNIPIHVKVLRVEYKRSPYFRNIVKYI